MLFVYSVFRGSEPLFSVSEHKTGTIPLPFVFAEYCPLRFAGWFIDHLGPSFSMTTHWDADSGILSTFCYSHLNLFAFLCLCCSSLPKIQLITLHRVRIWDQRDVGLNPSSATTTVGLWVLYVSVLSFVEWGDWVRWFLRSLAYLDGWSFALSLLLLV